MVTSLQPIMSAKVIASDSLAQFNAAAKQWSKSV
jgi:hypothetical protein